MAAGIRIAPYQPAGIRNEPVPGGGFQQVNAGAGDFGQALGAGVQQAAQQGKELAARLKEDATKDAEARAREADVLADQEDRSVLWDPKAGYYTKRGRAAVDAAQPTLQAIDVITARHAAQLDGNAEAQAIFKRIRAGRVRGLSDTMSAYANREGLVAQDTAAAARAQTSIDNGALDWQDDKRLATHYRSGLNDVVTVSQDKGDAPETTQFKAREFASKFHVATIGAALRTDPIRAKALFDRNIGSLTAQDRVTLEHQIEQRIIERAGADVAISVLMPGATTGYGNNIGNIVRSQFNYAGGKGAGHGAFETFDTPDHGVAAAYINIQAKAKQNGGTLSFLDLIGGNAKVRGWAPADDGANPMLKGNNPAAYAARLSAAVGLTPGDPVPLGDDAKMAAVLAEMNRIEKGRVTVPDSAFLGGIRLARGETPAPAQAGAPRAAPPRTSQDVVNDAFDATRGLSPEARLQAVTQALTIYSRQVEDETRRQAQAEHAIKLQGEQTGKALLDLYEARQLTVDHVQRAKPFLSESQYKAYLALANGQGGYDDTATVADLEGRLHREDVRGAAASALAEKKISLERFTSIMGRNETYLKDNAPASPFKQYRDYVNDALNPGILTDPAAMALGQVARAQALRDYDDFVRANPKLDPKEAASRLRQVSDDLVTRYATVQTREMAIALPMPRFTSFTKKADLGTAPATDVMAQLTAAARQLQVELDAGRITPAEAAREAEVLKSWTAITQRRLAQPPATPAKR